MCKSTLGTRNPAFGMLGILLMVNSRTSSSASVFLLLKVSCFAFHSSLAAADGCKVLNCGRSRSRGVSENLDIVKNCECDVVLEN